MNVLKMNIAYPAAALKTVITQKLVRVRISVASN